MSLAEIGRLAGLSRSLVSRMLSDDAAQKRPNPTLQTMKSICSAVEKATGTRLTLDALARAISPR